MIIVLLVLLIIYSIAMTVLAGLIWKMLKKRYRDLENKTELMMYWLQKKIDGGSPEDYFKKNAIKSVAFCGYTEVTEMLCAELIKYVDISFCLDENADNIWDGIDGVSIIKYDELSCETKIDCLIIANAETEEELRAKKDILIADRYITATELIKEL